MVCYLRLIRLCEDAAIPVHALEIQTVVHIMETKSSWFRYFWHGRVCAGTSAFSPPVSKEIFQSNGRC